MFVDRGIPIGAEDAGMEVETSGARGLGEGGGRGRRVGDVSRGMAGKEDVAGAAEVLAKLLVGMMCERDEDDEWL